MQNSRKTKKFKYFFLNKEIKKCGFWNCFKNMPGEEKQAKKNKYKKAQKTTIKQGIRIEDLHI